MKQRSLDTQKLLHREAVTHRSVYTREILHRDASTQCSIYTEKLLHRKVCTRSWCIEEPLHRTHQTALANRAFTTQKLLHGEVLKQRSFDTHRSFAHRSLDTGAFTRRNCYTEKSIHRGFRPWSFYTLRFTQ